jgi:hypothetical protein
LATSLTAAVQPATGGVLLQLTFTLVTSATITRVHPDGTAWPLRNANPVDVRSTTGVGATVFDYEAPLDTPVTYKASSTQTGTTFSSSAVTVPSDPGDVRSRAWLTHPLKPSLSCLVAVEDIGDRTRQARTGVLAIIGRADPIAITDTRLSGSGDLGLFTDTAAQAVKLRALLADGGVVLFRAPAAWHNAWFYAVLGDVAESGPGGWDASRGWRIGYTVVAPPAGLSQGAIGQTWLDVLSTYVTWTAEIAGEPTWNDLQAKVGP